MTDIKVTPLGAGQDVGRSCILLQMGGKNIMLDCGMHMGYNDEVSLVLVVQTTKFFCPYPNLLFCSDGFQTFHTLLTET